MVRDLGSDGTSVQEGMAVLEGALMETQGKRELGVETRQGLRFPRVYTRAGVNPFDEVEWDLRTAIISNEHGQMVFEQRDVEFPKFWSQMATNVVASKYFRGQMGTPQRERSVKQLIGRVVNTIAGWGRAQGYFASVRIPSIVSVTELMKHAEHCGFCSTPQLNHTGLLNEPF